MSRKNQILNLSLCCLVTTLGTLHVPAYAANGLQQLNGGGGGGGRGQRGMNAMNLAGRGGNGGNAGLGRGRNGGGGQGVRSFYMPSTNNAAGGNRANQTNTNPNRRVNSPFTVGGPASQQQQKRQDRSFGNPMMNAGNSNRTMNPANQRRFNLMQTRQTDSSGFSPVTSDNSSNDNFNTIDSTGGASATSGQGQLPPPRRSSGSVGGSGSRDIGDDNAITGANNNNSNSNTNGNSNSNNNGNNNGNGTGNGLNGNGNPIGTSTGSGTSNNNDNSGPTTGQGQLPPPTRSTGSAGGNDPNNPPPTSNDNSGPTTGQGQLPPPTRSSGSVGGSDSRAVGDDDATNGSTNTGGTSGTGT